MLYPLSYEAMRVVAGNRPKRALIVSYDYRQAAKPRCPQAKDRPKTRRNQRRSFPHKMSSTLRCRGRCRPFVRHSAAAQHLAIQPVMVKRRFAETHRGNVHIFDQADVLAELTRRVAVREAREVLCFLLTQADVLARLNMP